MERLERLFLQRHDRFRNPLWTMIPMDEEPSQIQREYVEILRDRAVQAAVQVVED